jgi:hypothetical protein
MTVTIYKSTDANAPALPSSSAESPAWLMNLLKACLVDGYTGKAAAGWALDYQDTTTGKERIGLSNGNGVVEFVVWDINGVGVMIWDSITTPGVGALKADNFADVISDGVNGLKHSCKPLPGVASEAMAGIYCNYINNPSIVAWTIYANDKAAWVRFHYPEGHATAEAGDSLNYAGSYHPVFFIGALKSPDLARDDFGNFTVMYGYQASPAGNISSSGNETAIYAISLRTPMGTVPNFAANASLFDYSVPSVEQYNLNPYSSMRTLCPVLFYYLGDDEPRPAAVLNSGHGRYTYAQLPGVVTLANSINSYGGFWGLYSAENAMTWNQQEVTINGLAMMPFGFSSGNGDGYGLTDDASWWP